MDHLKTSIECIYSLQICKKSQEQIYLAVSGCYPDYSNDKTDLFDLTDMVENNSVMSLKLIEENVKSYDKTILKMQSFIKTQAETIRKLTQERESFEAELGEIHSKYNDLKEKYEVLQDKNTELKNAHKKLKTRLDTKYQQFSRRINLLNKDEAKRTAIGAEKSLIGKRLCDETSPIVDSQDLRKNNEEEKDVDRQYQKILFDTKSQRTKAKEEIKTIQENLNKSQILRMEAIILQR